MKIKFVLTKRERAALLAVQLVAYSDMESISGDDPSPARNKAVKELQDGVALIDAIIELAEKTQP
jgi:hypothetical protein